MNFASVVFAVHFGSLVCGSREELSVVWACWLLVPIGMDYNGPPVSDALE